MQRVFDVALWVTWPSLFPEYVALMMAASAFAAIESLMGVCGLSVVAHAAAALDDGSLVYRASGIKILSEGKMFHN
jgi:hypothetical protein